MNASSGAQAPVILGIDDLRPLPRATRIARNGRDGVLLLEEHRHHRIDELWLDHDLGGDDTGQGQPGPLKPGGMCLAFSAVGTYGWPGTAVSALELR